MIRANTNADLFTVAAKGGYLFDAGQLRVGPIAGLQYTYATIKDYTETGDVLLTMMVDRQTRDALTGDAGVQFRYPLQIGNGIYTPFVNLTAAHDFLGGHTVTTTLVSAPLLPILTPVSVDGGTYGKVAAGVSALVADQRHRHADRHHQLCPPRRQRRGRQRRAQGGVLARHCFAGRRANSRASGLRASSSRSRLRAVIGAHSTVAEPNGRRRWAARG